MSRAAENSFDYVRRYYGVPAKRGMRVTVCSSNERDRMGTITRATHYVWIRLDGDKRSRPYHPKDPGIRWPTPSPEVPRE